MISILQPKNVGKLNLDEIDDHDADIAETVQLSNLKQLKVEYDAVDFKNL